MRRISRAGPMLEFLRGPLSDIVLKKTGGELLKSSVLLA